ncbi:MAG: phenylalanine--tRNA ligase subunit beta [Clostridiaceae bacterium]
MKVPVYWLKDYMDIDINGKELGDRLTLSGSKVEEVIVSGDEIKNVVTGKILKIEQHPDAEKLVVCQLDVAAGEPVQIVTGANNMKEGDIVPAALHGAVLPNGLKIKKGKLRGVVSNGMMCSEEELGIAGENEVHGLMILNPDTPIGKDIKEVLGLNKEIIDFEITSNRPDCLSVTGIARETAATLGTSFEMPDFSYNETNPKNINDELEVTIKDTLCKRYLARGVKNVKVAPSPAWMQERLTDAGVRPINNIVDITNFVMLELGQPMHAFDKREISSNHIIIERAKSGEKFTTLDEIKRDLDDTMLCIKDGGTTIALAGIMGGLDSEIKEDTSEVIFEFANFDGTNIRVNSKKLNLRTEASSRFEKDIDPNLVELAANRACALVQELGCGEVMEGTIDIYPEVKEEKEMAVSSVWVNKFLGTKISKEDMKKYLDRLEIKTEVYEDDLIIKIPTFRIDLDIKEDIAEEIARIYGYNNIPATISASTTEREPKYRKEQLDDLLIETLLSSGINQSISYSFVSPKVFDEINLPKDSVLRNAVKIKNPLGEDYSIMRTTTVPSIMESLKRNYSRSNDYVRLFEIGRTYFPNEDEKSLPKETNILTIGMYGECDYLDLKGVVENILDALGIRKFSLQRELDNPCYHPGKTAALFIGKQKAGVFGEIHPDLLENYEIDTPGYMAELNLDMLYEAADTVKGYKALPKFPAVSRDIALLVDDAVLVGEIEETIVKAGGNIVETVTLFDIYKGKQIPEGKKSIAYAISYRDENKTLTDKEVNKVHEKILRSLEYKLGAQLR